LTRAALARCAGGATGLRAALIRAALIPSSPRLPGLHTVPATARAGANRLLITCGTRCARAPVRAGLPRIVQNQPVRERKDDDRDGQLGSVPKSVSSSLRPEPALLILSGVARSFSPGGKFDFLLRHNMFRVPTYGRATREWSWYASEAGARKRVK